MMNQPADERFTKLPVRDGQERLATQSERDDVNHRIAAGARDRKATVLRIPAANSSDARREAGDQVNRFLLCALVKESSRQIKASTKRAGESPPMSTIVRGVLRSYRLAAMDENGPLSGTTLDSGELNLLNQKILRSEIARHSLDRVKNSQESLARAERVGDDARIKIERGGLEQAIESRERMLKAFL